MSEQLDAKHVVIAGGKVMYQSPAWREMLEWRDYNQPASTLAAIIHNPLARLNTPKAVPRSAGGDASATIVAKVPCVQPICSPQIATPIIFTDLKSLFYVRLGRLKRE